MSTPTTQAASQPKVTAVELVVHTADGQMCRYEFNGGNDGHDLRVSFEEAVNRERLHIVDSLRTDPLRTEQRQIVATVTASTGWGSKPLLTAEVVTPQDPT